jgi:SAM-dependent methyltransferase
MPVYDRSAPYYDIIYDTKKDYAEEAKRLHTLIQKHKQTSGRALLDVACGTGRHISLLRKFYDAEGLDLSKQQLKIARKRNPGVNFYHGNMLNFRLRKKYDVITCLFSAIGYTKTVSKLRQAMKNMAGHLNAGGVLIVEPWITPDLWKTGRIDAIFIDQPKLKIARMNTTERRGKISVTDFHFLVGTPESIRYFVESHEMGLFSHREYMAAVTRSGLNAVYDPKGLTGRGLYIAKKPPKVVCDVA